MWVASPVGLVRRGSLRPPPLVQGGTFGTTQTTTSVLRARPNGGLGGSPEGHAAHTGAQQLARPARRPNRVVPSGPRACDPRKAHCLVYDQPGCSADSPGGRGGVRRTTVRPPADLVFSRKLVRSTRLLADSPSGPWSPERGSGQPRRMSRLGWIRGWAGVATCD